MNKLLLILSTFFLIAHTLVPHEHELVKSYEYRDIDIDYDVADILLKGITLDIGLNHLENYVTTNIQTDVIDNYEIDKFFNLDINVVKVFIIYLDIYNKPQFTPKILLINSPDRAPPFV